MNGLVALWMIAALFIIFSTSSTNYQLPKNKWECSMRNVQTNECTQYEMKGRK